MTDDAIRLQSLGGEAAPGPLLDDLRKLAALPDAALDALEEVMIPCVAEPLAGDIDALVAGFAARHSIEEGALADALGGGRTLLRGASANDLDGPALAADVASLPGAAVLIAPMVRVYAATKAALREEIRRETFADHGRVLEGVAWRVETVSASQRGKNLGASVAVLTLRYRDGTRTGRVTLQAPAAVLRELKAICERLVG